MKNQTVRWMPTMAGAVVALAASGPAGAFEFRSGEVTGAIDSTLSIGGAWRMEDRDPFLVGFTNGGAARDVNSDDGNLNFNKGDPISSVVKLTTDVSVNYRNMGLFLRGTAFHDFIAQGKDELVPAAKDELATDAELLDAYVRAGFDPGGKRLEVRAGKQVVSWGESTFILNGLNAINPVDVAKVRVPGAELREALTPVNMVWATQELTPSLSVEGFVQAEWEPTEIDPRGSFFSTTDALSTGGDKIFIGSGRRFDQHRVPNVAFGVVPGVSNLSAHVWAPRSADRTPDDSGQGGLAMRWFAQNLNNTEFGLYAMNTHSRTPYLSAVRGAASVASIDATSAAVLAAGGCTTASTLVNFNVLLGFNPLGQGICVGGAQPLVAANYYADYPEDIRTYGLSFNTSVPGGVALQGEYSYRSNQPVQLATTELILAAGGLANNITGGNTAAASVLPGTVLEGYRRVKVHQMQVTATKAFGPTIGAEQFVLLGEVGYQYQDLPDGLLFNGPGVFLPAAGSSTATTAGSTQPNMEGYATKNSAGYRLVGRLDFPNAIGAITVSPRLAFSHDTHGVSATFNEDTKAATFGIGFNYQQTLQADIAYTAYWGGRTYSGTDPVPTPGQGAGYATNANPLNDRDFLAISLSYSF